MNDFYEYIAKKIYKFDRYCLSIPIEVEINNIFLSYATTLVENIPNFKVAICYPFVFGMEDDIRKLYYTNSFLLWRNNHLVNNSNGSSLIFYKNSHDIVSHFDRIFIFNIEHNDNYKIEFIDKAVKHSNKITINIRDKSLGDVLIKKYNFKFDSFTLEDMKNIKKIERKEKLKNIL